MIHYMPFTYINPDQIKRLALILGPFSVCQLGPSQVPEGMQPGLQNGWIIAHHPLGLDPARLQSAIRDYQQWAALHEGRLAAVVGFQRSRSNPPLVDDTAPSRISSQIRHYEDGLKTDHVPSERLLKNALFLAMAQIYDEQQDSIYASLTEVQRLEELMISQLSAEPAPQRQTPAADPVFGVLARDEDRGGVFTAQRITAWAYLAAHLDRPADLYVTSSKKVWETVLDSLPAARALGRLSLKEGPADVVQAQSLDAVMQAVAAADDPLQIPLTQAHPTIAHCLSALLTLVVVPGRRPHSVLADLAPQCGPDRWPDSDQRHTIFGYLEL